MTPPPRPATTASLIGCSWCRTPVRLVQTLFSYKAGGPPVLMLLDPDPHQAGRVHPVTRPDGTRAALVLSAADVARARGPLWRAHHQSCIAAATKTRTPEPGSQLIMSRHLCPTCQNPMPIVLLTIGEATHPTCPLPDGPGPFIAGAITPLANAVPAENAHAVQSAGWNPGHRAERSAS